MGLVNVRQIAIAHDWNPRLNDAPEGGLRVEVDDVRVC